MQSYSYIRDFEELGFGMFVHFGLYSVLGKGEWAQHVHKIPPERYEQTVKRFRVDKNWARELIKTAKDASAKYINITTRHHDGFSLYDTQGLSDYDSLHSACGRDLIAEFVQACNDGGIVPFFYHTLLDWHNPDYKNDFPKYIDYLVNSVEILCRNYGKIGGLWFDGMWDKPNENWQQDRLYGIIKKYQPTAMIINNTGLSELGKVGHIMIDSVTFERGKPAYADNSDRPRAGEMCQVLNDHWGYAAHDCNYKSVKELVENLVDCRKYNCNFLLNTGLRGNGKVNPTDKCILAEVGKWVKANKDFVYGVKCADIAAENADVLTDGQYYYAVIKDVVMTADPNVTKEGVIKKIVVHSDKKIQNAVWLDTLAPVSVQNNILYAEPFAYGTSLSVRVARFMLK